MHRELKIAGRFAGLTIIEVVAASILLVVVMVPILRCLTIAHASTIKIEHKTRSLMLAQAKLDQIRVRSIYDYTNSGASFAENSTSIDGSYLCNVTDNSGDPLKAVTVSVGFDSNGDSTLSAGEVEATVATLIARRWTD